MGLRPAASASPLFCCLLPVALCAQSKPVRVSEVLDPVDGSLTVTASFKPQELALLCTIFLGKLTVHEPVLQPYPHPTSALPLLCADSSRRCALCPRQTHRSLRT